MFVGVVVDNVWSTRKDESLKGLKFMIVRLIENTSNSEGRLIVAADPVGAGRGEKVLVVIGSAARFVPDFINKPVDAAIVGIIDEETEK